MKSSRRAVRCAKCSHFLFNIDTIPDSIPVGAIAEVRDVRCSKCGLVNNVSIGIADKDTRGHPEKIEEKLLEKLKKED